MATNTFLRRKRRWSLVRIFVSLVPEMLWKYFLPYPIRIHFNQNINFLTSKIKCDICQTGSPRNFSSFKSYLNNSCKASEINLNSTPKLELTSNDSRISDIQKDLEELKDQVAKIIRQQQEKQFDDSKISPKTFPNSVATSKIQSVPRVHPPPPPPLPTHLISAKSSGPVTLQKLKREKQNRLQPRPPIEGFPCGEELLRDLKKVQLKKVQKSPGGGPLKKEKHSSQDPGNILEEILKKRFSYMQNISSDTSPDSTVLDLNDSFSSDLCHKNIYEFPNKASTAAS